MDRSRGGGCVAKAVGRLLVALAAILGDVGGAAIEAKEPVTAFLDGLRQRQYFDVAEAYLEGLKNDPNVSDELRQTIPYEQGKLLVENARTLRDTTLRTKELDRASAKFEEFIRASPAHPLVPGCNVQLGNVLVERGKALIDGSKRPSNLDKKDAMLKQARELFAQSKKVFDEAEVKFQGAVDAFPKFIDPKDEKKIEARELALADLIQARLFVATVLYEDAKSYPATAPEYKKLLTESAAKFHALYEKYRRRLAGLYAGMWEARNLQEMGDAKRALGIYEELLAQPDAPEEFRALKAKTLRLALEAWTTEKEKQYVEAAKRGEEWLTKARVSDERTPEGLGIAYYTALAYDLQIQALKPDAKDDRKKKISALSEHALKVAKIPGEYQQHAKELLAKYRDLGDKGPQTFAEARDAGKAALEAMQVAENKKRLAPVTKETAKIPEFEKDRLAARADALRHYNMALAMKDKDKEVSLDDVNVIRYFLTFLNYDADNAYDAAVLGEFLARRYPKSAGARPAAKLALFSYLKTYNASKPENRQFDADRMVALANYIAETWPTEPEADEAWMTLGDLAIRENNLDKAAEYLGKVPADSPRRGDADLKAGQALWGSFLKSNRLPADERPAQADLDKLSQQAQQTLERGVSRMRKAVTDAEPATYTLLASELSLAQIYIGSGQPEKAVTLLETPKTGALALVQAKNDVVEKGNFPEETYKAALRAYVGAQQMDKAEQMMTALDARVAASGGDEVTLTKIYISLGRELEEQVQTLRGDPKREADLQKVLKGFETFLSRISSRDKGNTFSSLNWVGETFFRLASGLDAGGTSSKEAQSYYAAAAKTYQGMLAKAKADPSFAPKPESLLGCELRLSLCEAREGNFKEALDRLEPILMKNPRMLEGQKQAAQIYQEWGKVSPGYYINAMSGGRRDRATNQNVMWGWSHLSVMVQRNPTYRPVFFEARLNLAECRFKLAMSKSGAEKTSLLEKAIQDVTITYKLYPDLGGEENVRQFDRLLKTAQQAAGLKPAGLAGIDAEKAAAAKTATAAGGR